MSGFYFNPVAGVAHFSRGEDLRHTNENAPTIWQSRGALNRKQHSEFRTHIMETCICTQLAMSNLLGPCVTFESYSHHILSAELSQPIFGRRGYEL